LPIKTLITQTTSWRPASFGLAFERPTLSLGGDLRIRIDLESLAYEPKLHIGAQSHQYTILLPHLLTWWMADSRSEKFMKQVVIGVQ
jgi:hypothetical protein